MKIVERIAVPRRTLALVSSFVLITIAWFQFGPAAPLTATGVPLLDTLSEYTPDQLYDQLAGYGEIGRDQYALFLAGDFIWVLMFGIAAMSVLGLALRRTRFDNPPWNWLAWVPAAVVGLDWLENAALLTLTLRFPTRMNDLASGIPAVTGAKMAISNLSLGLLLIGLAAIGFSYAMALRGRARRQRRLTLE